MCVYMYLTIILLPKPLSTDFALELWSDAAFEVHVSGTMRLVLVGSIASHTLVPPELVHHVSEPISSWQVSVYSDEFFI